MGWKNKPTNFALEIEKVGDEHLRKVSAEMLQQVIVGSPVDQGAFRGNHLISLNGADNSYDINRKDKNSNSTQEVGNQKILQAKLGDLVYVQNNLPYAVALENGHSQQRPLGIYSVAFMNVASKYK